MEFLWVIGVPLIAVLCIAAIVFLTMVAMDLIDLSEVVLTVLAVFLGLVIIGGAIWVFVSLDFT